MHNNSWNLFIRHGVFIKYEYWLNYLNELNAKYTYLFNIRIFREQQMFFKWYGFLQKSIRYFYLLFFAQKDQKLLQQLGKTNV
jgi:3-deoxy-D-manno-octulosonic-acid transferase